MKCFCIKEKINPAVLTLLFLFFSFALLFLSSCDNNRTQKYIIRENDCYHYDENAEIFIKYPSEFNFSDKEFMTMENGKTKYITGIPTNITIPESITSQNFSRDIVLPLYYTITDNGILLASPLTLDIDFKYSDISNNSDSVLLWIDTYNAFLVNVTAQNQAAISLFDDFTNSEFNMSDNSLPKNLVWVEIVSVSPDGKYILFKSNRYHINTDAKKFDLFVKNLETNEESKILDFYKKDFIGWNKKSENSTFLYRDDLTEPNTSQKKYSDIKSYDLDNNNDTVFFNISMQYDYGSYELANDEYFYFLTSETRQKTLNFVNIYTSEVLCADIGSYSFVQDVKLSHDKKYAVFSGTYINSDGIAISEIVSIHFESNTIISYTEVSDAPYVVDSFYVIKDNILVINFLNTINPSQNKSQFYRINH